METKRIGIQLAALLAFQMACVGPSFAASDTSATLLVTIVDENGSLLHSAHVYIFSKDKKMFFGTREAYGMTTFILPEGAYRIYAGMTSKTQDVIDHYSSPEAQVSLTSSEPTSVILTLQKAGDSENFWSDAARQKLEIGPELAKYLN